MFFTFFFFDSLRGCAQKDPRKGEEEAGVAVGVDVVERAVGEMVVGVVVVPKYSEPKVSFGVLYTKFFSCPHVCHSWFLVIRSFCASSSLPSMGEEHKR